MDRISEADLDHAFAETLLVSRDFQIWFLSQGRFARYSQTARLMNEEQAAARTAKHWWKHWWTRMPDGSEGETDIFLVFETPDAERFAVHIENKPPHGTLTLRQAVDYRKRAIVKAHTAKWLNYSDFEVVLLTPRAFADGNAEAARQYDRVIHYEDIAGFAPLFGTSLARTR